MSLRERIAAAAKAVPLASLPTPPVVGVVLGSGLGAFGDTLDGLVKTPYASLPGMPQSGVIGHAGNLCLGTVGGASVACLQGRVHAYEGHDLDTVTFGVRLLAAIGCKAILITNAAGGLNATFSPGDLMVISDHLNLTGKNPLIGPNDDTLGPRFPDMTTAYDPALRKLAHEAGREAGVSLREGVYAGLSGPTYETPAEVRMLRTLGADAVGMSTVPEVIVLHHQKVRVVAISCITNLAAGTSPTPLDHKEVEETARATRDSFVGLLRSLLPKVAHAVTEIRPS
jgi:purine-nucleoside phosphorylase